jgi:hypothetical protein
MAGENAYIWQVQTSAGSGQRTTAGDANTVSFNNTGKVPSGGAYISDISVDFRRAVPENEAVDTDNNEIQDMGIGGIDIMIKGVIGDADNDVSTNPINKFSKWLQDGNTTTGYTKGRYGLELENAPQWDVTPTSTYGYHIRYVRFNYIGEKKDMAEFEIALALGGDLATAI